MSKYPSIEVEQAGALLTVRIHSIRTMNVSDSARSAIHWEVGEFFSELRGRNDVRVVVLTGAQDGLFLGPVDPGAYRSREWREHRNDPQRIWRIFTGMARAHESLVALEKPVIARVNGDAMGFGASLMFGCDLIVAVETARIADIHLGMGEVDGYGPDYGVVPGDGGAVYAPLVMSPALAKEYLMLSREFTAKELADRSMINYSVPEDKLDAKVEELANALLRRPSYALAWTKRVASRNVAQQLALTLDAAAAYEMVNFAQIERLGWRDPECL